MKDDPPLTPALLLQAYEIGLFPMSEGRNDPEIFWVDPMLRGVFPLDRFRISKRLARTIRQDRFRISFDTAFTDVMQGCADRPETWINETIFGLYAALHERGCAHSVEVWNEEGLVGGVYGVSIGAAFFGESMFSRATDASKVGLAHLIDRLRVGGYQLFDTQFTTPHLESLGAIEIPRRTYQQRLAVAVRAKASFDAGGQVSSGEAIVQRNAQTS